MHGITNDKMLDWFIHGLEPIISCEVLKENPQTSEEASILAKRISQIKNLVGGGGTRSKWHEPLGYAPMELNSMGTRWCHRQPDKSGKKNQANKPRPTCFVFGKKGHISR